MWTEGDARREIKTVRSMHAAVQDKLKSTPVKELHSKTSLVGKLPSGSTPVVDAGLFRKDMEESGLTVPIIGFPSASYTTETSCPINQGEMGMTQFGFLGLFLLYPDKFGAAGTSQEDLDAFAHFWRGIGYLLGMEDDYNICNGSIEVVHTNCQKVGI